MTPIPPPTATSPATGDQTPVRLVIPAINLDRKLYPVGLDQNNVPVVLDHDVGWYIYSAKPGEGENIVLWGHVLRFRKAPHIPAPFALVDRLAIGSEILLYSADGAVFRYVVARKERVTPDQVEYILPTGDERLTLVSCIGDRVIVEGNVELTHRLITIAVPAP
ncbi:sortase [Chloroflexus sp.]|uniref:sortase n=1 Tax=Chloroflexus sp. TaxID=1904827 RepID=UPI002602B106|nr:class F sortase [uncultured Chloroflexus sp.]